MNPKIVTSYTLICLIIGAVAAGLFASQNQATSSSTYQVLAANLVQPTDALTSPRTYNQTLVEAIDKAKWQSSLTDLGYPTPTDFRFDVLPDSFNIQITAGFGQSLPVAQQESLPADLVNLLRADSQTLATALLGTATAVTVHTQTLGESAVIQQNPIAATVYGAIAGALFGLFLGLALTGDHRK